MIHAVYRRPYEEYSNLPDILVAAKVAENALTPTLPSPCHPDLHTLVQSCWNKEPTQRPSIVELQEKMNTIFSIYNADPKDWQERYQNNSEQNNNNETF